MNIVKSKIAPNPKEATYWADMTANKYGKVIKVWSRGKWEPIAGEGDAGISDVDYNDVENKPMINGVVLKGNISLDDLGVIDAEDVAQNIPSEYITEEELAESVYDKEEMHEIISNVEGSNIWNDIQ